MNGIAIVDSDATGLLHVEVSLGTNLCCFAVLGPKTDSGIQKMTRVHALYLSSADTPRGFQFYEAEDKGSFVFVASRIVSKRPNTCVVLAPLGKILQVQ